MAEQRIALPTMEAVTAFVDAQSGNFLTEVTLQQQFPQLDGDNLSKLLKFLYQQGVVSEQTLNQGGQEAHEILRPNQVKLLVPDYMTGQKVKCFRGSGAIDEGWQITAYAPKTRCIRIDNPNARLTKVIDGQALAAFLELNTLSTTESATGGLEHCLKVLSLVMMIGV